MIFQEVPSGFGYANAVVGISNTGRAWHLYIRAGGPLSYGCKHMQGIKTLKCEQANPPAKMPKAWRAGSFANYFIIVAAIFLLGLSLAGCGVVVPRPVESPEEGEQPSLPSTSEAFLPSTSEAVVYLIHDFESGSYTRTPSWWKFDNVTLTIQNNTSLPGGTAEVENYSLHITGEAADYYIGGLGYYLGRIATEESQISLDIYGTGANSGQIKIELYDDDDGNWTASSEADDIWVCQFPVDWSGWQHKTIKFSDFTISNPGKGDGVWNPYGAGGGLLQIQLIALASTPTGTCIFYVDNIEFTKPKP